MNNISNTQFHGLEDYLKKEYASLNETINELTECSLSIPEVITSHQDYEAAVALCKRADSISKKSNDTRTDEKKPYLEAGRTIDGFFNSISERATDILKPIKLRCRLFLERKEEEERERLRQEQKKLQEEADKKLQEAAALAEAGKAASSEIALNDASRAEDTAAIAKDVADYTSTNTLTKTRTAAAATSLSSFWNFDIVDREKIDLNKMKNLLSSAELTRMIAAHIRAYAPPCSASAPDEINILDGVRVFKDRKMNMR